MGNINQEIPKAIMQALEKKGMTQQELAETLKKPRQNINAYLSGARGKIPDVWLEMLDAVGLELVVKVKK